MPVRTMLQLRDAKAAVSAYSHATEGKVVDADEVLRRARICATCPVKAKPRVRLRDQASRVLGILANRHRVPDVIKAYKCGVCDCSLLLLVPCVQGDLPDDNGPAPADRSRTKAEYRAAEAPNCWLPAERDKPAEDQPE